MKRTVTICYTTALGGNRTFSHKFTGTDADIDAEVERVMGLPDVMNAWAE